MMSVNIMKVDAAEASVEEITFSEGTVRTGTLGDNNGIQWTYDESTKTLTITGEDSGLHGELVGYQGRSIFYDICSDVKMVILNKCSIKENAKFLFAGLDALKDVETNEFDCSNITDMSYMFYGCASLRYVDLKEFDTSEVTNMKGMFTGCSSLTSLDVSNFNTSKVTDMGSMFDNCSSLTSLDVSNFDTSKVTYMGGMFNNCNSLISLNVSNFDTSKVTKMTQMFGWCRNLTSLEIGHFDTSQVQDMSFMFCCCSGLTNLDISNFDTEQVTSMLCMFSECTSLIKLDISSFDISNIKEGRMELQDCKKLALIYTPKRMVEGQYIILPYTFYDLQHNNSGWSYPQVCNTILTNTMSNVIIETPIVEITNGESLQLLLNICGEIQDSTINSNYIWSVDNEEIASISDMGLMRGVSEGNVTITCTNKEDSTISASINITINKAPVIRNGGVGDNSGIQWTYDEKTKMLTITGEDSGVNGSVFYDICSDVKKIYLYNCKLIGDVSGLFSGLESLETVEIENLDTSEVTNMSFMFASCSNLISLDVSQFDTSEVTDMGAMFDGCHRLARLDVSGFDTSKVTDMSKMFYYCGNLVNLDVSRFDTSKVEYMGLMFDGCSSLTSLNLSNFDTSKVEIFDGMLRNCFNLATIETPQKMAESQTITLPYEFYDSEKNSTTEITPEFCNKTLTNTISNLKIESPSQEVTIGNTLQLSLSITGEAQDITANAYYIWTTNNEEVVTVSDTGLVTGVGMGTARITCVAKENASEVAYFEITIEVPFGDLSVTDWQYPYVVYAYDNNLMTGKGSDENGNSIFDPNEGLTREQFAQILYSAEGKEEMAYTDRFTDVANGQWYTSAILWAAEKGIVSGYPTGEFGVSDNITREQLAAMLYKYAESKGYDITAREAFDRFTDAAEVSSWATNQLQWAVANGIMNGKGEELDPQGSATRAECAVMLKAFMVKFTE